jgi:hypothetical protein
VSGSRGLNSPGMLGLFLLSVKLTETLGLAQCGIDQRIKAAGT